YTLHATAVNSTTTAHAPIEPIRFRALQCTVLSGHDAWPHGRVRQFLPAARDRARPHSPTATRSSGPARVRSPPAAADRRQLGPRLAAYVLSPLRLWLQSTAEIGPADHHDPGEPAAAVFRHAPPCR